MIIYTGRFQPFHKGHLGLVHTLIEMYPQEIICLAVIKNVPIQHADGFDSFANKQLASQRNPFNCMVTLRLIEHVLCDEQLHNNVVVTLLPRPSMETWNVISNMFDCDRTWVFTQNSIVTDEWENKKCAFFHKQGEKTMRIRIQKFIEGTDIRNAIAQKNYDLLKTMLPEPILNYIQYGQL